MNANVFDVKKPHNRFLDSALEKPTLIKDLGARLYLNRVSSNSNAFKLEKTPLEEYVITACGFKKIKERKKYATYEKI